MLPPDWGYEIIQPPNKNATVETHCGLVQLYEARYAVFGMDHMACGWTHYFIGRILLGEVLLDAQKAYGSGERVGRGRTPNRLPHRSPTDEQSSQRHLRDCSFFLRLGPRTNKRDAGGGRRYSGVAATLDCSAG